jgi:hypothetical protein
MVSSFVPFGGNAFCGAISCAKNRESAGLISNGRVVYCRILNFESKKREEGRGKARERLAGGTERTVTNRKKRKSPKKNF